jgi:hypothetical protein
MPPASLCNTHTFLLSMPKIRFDTILSIPISFLVTFSLLVGKPEGKRPFGRPIRRWEDNIKMNVQEVGGVMGPQWSWLRIERDGGHLWLR